jgi:hypothetical protein
VSSIVGVYSMQYAVCVCVEPVWLLLQLHVVLCLRALLFAQDTFHLSNEDTNVSHLLCHG